MADQPTLPRSLLRRAENTELSLGSLEAISEIRAYLDELEKLAMVSAREKGATVEDIADALKLTPQAIYYRFRHEKMNVQTTPGEPNEPEAARVPEAALAPEVATDPVDDPVLAPDMTPPN
jgi:transposase-like protein